MFINPDDKILFMGDSITEKGSHGDHNRIYGGANLGVGYAMMAASMIKAYHPDWNNEFVNKGITGNTVTQVKERWQEDALDINPDVLSIMVGINDICKNIALFEGMVPWGLSIEELMAQYEADYRYILSESVKQNPNLKIIMRKFYLAALFLLTSSVFSAEITGRVMDAASKKGLAGIRVSNGIDVVLTDDAGKYTLPRRKNTRFVSV
ncbi:MAG: hypothetical protein IKB55_01415, partial [Clostridia bacterium]|nr:hypothetical protein [Clostridia bacterium]